MKHTLSLTYAAAALASNLLALPQTFETPADIVRVSGLLDKLTEKLPEKITKENAGEQLPEIEVTEKERDLLKHACTKHAAVIPPGKPAVLLLTQLGLAE